MRAAFTFFPVKKSKQKRPVQKKAIAKHRSFSSQNAFSIALIIIRLFLLCYKAIDALLTLHLLSLVF
jgi:hypothetical protein